MKGISLNYTNLCDKKPQKWEMVFKHFYYFVDGKCTFNDVDLCRKFREYLLNDARQMKQAGDKRIKENANEYLDKIKWKET